MRTLRTKETEAKYKEVIKAGHLKNGCPLCKAATIKEFVHWRIIDNAYPYDAVAEKHHMIVTKEHVDENDLSQTAAKELLNLKPQLSDDYMYLLESLPKQKSIPRHHHLHLLVAKDRDFS